jgi:hypothetical protein
MQFEECRQWLSRTFRRAIHIRCGHRRRRRVHPLCAARF